MNPKQRIDFLRNELSNHNYLYYVLDTPKISDFERLDGACALDAETLYSGSGLFHDSIGRVSNFGSSGRRNFAFFETPSQTSDPAKIPIQAENPIQNQTCHPVDTPTCSEWSLRVLWLFQPTVDRP